MLAQQKYLLTLTFSHLITSFIVMNETNCNLQLQMYLYIFIPIGLFIFASIAYKYIQSMLIYVVSFGVLAICIYMFWSNENIMEEIFIHIPSFGCIVYLMIMLIGAIIMPLTRPNGIFGIRIQQTEDYPEVWHRTHIFTSLLLSFMILPTIIVIFYMESNVSFILCNFFLMSSLVIGTVYAVIITIPIDKAEKEQLAKELEDQIKKEQGYR